MHHQARRTNNVAWKQGLTCIIDETLLHSRVNTEASDRLISHPGMCALSYSWSRALIWSQFAYSAFMIRAWKIESKCKSNLCLNPEFETTSNLRLSNRPSQWISAFQNATQPSTWIGIWIGIGPWRLRLEFEFELQSRPEQWFGLDLRRSNS